MVGGSAIMIFPKYLPEKYYEINESVVPTTNISKTVNGTTGQNTWVLHFSRVGNTVTVHGSIKNIDVLAGQANIIFITLPAGLEEYGVDRQKRTFIFTPLSRQGLTAILRKTDLEQVGLSNNQVWEIQLQNDGTINLTGQVIDFLMVGQRGEVEIIII